MPTRSINTHVRNLLDAAEALLAARDHQTVTADEWNGLRRAVNAHGRFQRALDRWSIVDDCLVYRRERQTRRCSFRSYIAVAAAINKLSGTGFLASQLRRRENLSTAEVAVALRYLLLHGCIEGRGTRKYAAAGSETYIDAMHAWNALAASTETT